MGAHGDARVLSVGSLNFTIRLSQFSEYDRACMHPLTDLSLFFFRLLFFSHYFHTKLVSAAYAA